MPLDGNGGYNPPSPENPVRAGTLIKSEDFNTTIDDISDALSTAMYRDGQGVIEADLDMGHHRLLRVGAVQNDETLRLISGENKVQVSGVIKAEGIALQDDREVKEFTTLGGEENGGKAALLNADGFLDGSMLVSPAAPDYAREIMAGADIEAGDFVYIAGDHKVYPCSDNSTQGLAGFVLTATTAGADALVHFIGYNPKVTILDTPTYGNTFVYVDKYIANAVRYVPNGGKAVGYVVGENIVRFVPNAAGAMTNTKLYYIGNIS